MDDRNLQAPWVGVGREDYYEDEHEILGHCEECGKELYEDDEIYDVCDGCICEECHDRREEDEED